MNKKRYVFFDRDGTINKEVHYLHKIEDVELYEQVRPALKKLQEAGYGIIFVTNQSGIGRGYYSLEQMHAVNKHIEEILAKDGIKIDRIYFCPHLPNDGCKCRKPATGMIDQAVNDFNLEIDEIWVVGDKPCDVQLGQNAGGKGILVRTGHGSKYQANNEFKPNYIAEDLAEAVEFIIKENCSN